MSEPTLKKVQLVINKMTREQYSDLSARGEISPDQLYLLPEDEEKSIQEQVDEIEAKIPSAATSENQADVRAQCRSTSIHKENLLCRVRHCVCPSQQSKWCCGLGLQKTFE